MINWHAQNLYFLYNIVCTNKNISVCFCLLGSRLNCLKAMFLDMCTLFSNFSLILLYYDSRECHCLFILIVYTCYNWAPANSYISAKLGLRYCIILRENEAFYTSFLGKFLFLLWMKLLCVMIFYKFRPDHINKY